MNVTRYKVEYFSAYFLFHILTITINLRSNCENPDETANMETTLVPSLLFHSHFIKKRILMLGYSKKYPSQNAFKDMIL